MVRVVARRKVSTTIYLRADQADALRLRSERTQVPQAVLVRDAVDLLLGTSARRPARGGVARGPMALAGRESDALPPPAPHHALCSCEECSCAHEVTQ